MTDTPQDPGPAMPADGDKTSNDRLREGMHDVADKLDKATEAVAPRVEKTARDLWGKITGKKNSR